LFAGSNSGGKHWAIIATLIQSAKLNDVDPLAWLTDVLERIVSGRTKRHELGRLLPWKWKAAKAVETHDTTQRLRAIPCPTSRLPTNWHRPRKSPG
jgi:IS66 C-terminal element